jgi:hypothetical protein
MARLWPIILYSNSQLSSTLTLLFKILIYRCEKRVYTYSIKFKYFVFTFNDLELFK